MVEDYRVFAWCSNTQIKTIIICDVATSEADVKEILQSLYNAYVLCMQNPFQNTTKSILPSTSQKLVTNIANQIKQYNEFSAKV